jgi:hypothetical protein
MFTGFPSLFYYHHQVKKAQTHLYIIINPIMTIDYFEIDRLVDDLARLYSTACATAWFKIRGNKHPSKEEFRDKVVEFMRHFEYTLGSFPQTSVADQFREHARKSLDKEIAKVLAGENKDVEKRYKYYVDYS